MGDHSSSLAVASEIKRPTRRYSEAGRFIPLYLAFLPVGFAMPSMSPSKRWALTLSLPAPPFHPYPINKDETVYFLLHFPSRHRDSALRSTVPCGARTFLPLNNKSEDLLQPAITSSTFILFYNSSNSSLPSSKYKIRPQLWQKVRSFLDIS